MALKTSWYSPAHVCRVISPWSLKCLLHFMTWVAFPRIHPLIILLLVMLLFNLLNLTHVLRLMSVFPEQGKFPRFIRSLRWPSWCSHIVWHFSLNAFIILYHKRLSAKLDWEIFEDKENFIHFYLSRLAHCLAHRIQSMKIC